MTNVKIVKIGIKIRARFTISISILFAILKLTNDNKIVKSFVSLNKVVVGLRCIKKKRDNGYSCLFEMKNAEKFVNKLLNYFIMKFEIRIKP